MRKIIPLIFSVFSALSLFAQANGGWGNCEFTTVATMNAFDPSGSTISCKKVYVQATDEHYRWNGTTWELERPIASEVPFTPAGTISSTDVQAAIEEVAAESVSSNIYTDDGTLDENRMVTMDGNNLTFDGTNDVVIESDGDVGIGLSAASTELDVNGTGLFRNGSNWSSSGNGQIQFGYNSTNTHRHSIKSRHFNSINYNSLDFFVWRYGVDGINDLGSLHVMSVSDRNSGSVGIGTLNPSSKLEVSGGNVRFSDYGSGTYDDSSPQRLLGVQADGDVVEVDLSSNGFQDNIYNTNGTLDGNRTVEMDGNSLTFDGTSDVVIESDGDVGIGVASPTTELDVDGIGLFRNGSNWSSTGDGQLQFGYNSTNTYRHSIKSRHFNSALYNGLDFFVWQHGVDGVNDLGSLQVMSVTGRNSGSVGIGTLNPDAKLEVSGGNVRFSDYGSGTYDDSSPQRLLGVQADGDVVELNTAKSSKVFYPPALVIDVSSTGDNRTLDLHQEYVSLFASPMVGSTGAPTAIPTYTESELFYYVTDYDITIFSDLSIDAAGVLTYDVDVVPTDNCAVLNVVFVVK